jgi:hypothetical protein
LELSVSTKVCAFIIVAFTSRTTKKDQSCCGNNGYITKTNNIANKDICIVARTKEGIKKT